MSKLRRRGIFLKPQKYQIQLQVCRFLVQCSLFKNLTVCVISTYNAQSSCKRPGFYSVKGKSDVRLFRNLIMNTE